MHEGQAGTSITGAMDTTGVAGATESAMDIIVALLKCECKKQFQPANWEGSRRLHNCLREVGTSWKMFRRSVVGSVRRISDVR